MRTENRDIVGHRSVPFRPIYSRIAQRSHLHAHIIAIVLPETHKVVRLHPSEHVIKVESLPTPK